ncbi:unnamed protein product [Adineta steineri]|uniref:DYW domain-containing protein n=1 Tax=Adineta steineri TaxID=433720 RepID=A0A813Z0X8_9BILA|nr:unnamed protein product [Adineta steineri]CAF3841595.1 unnamed protein product [Adineta steineri]CAF3955153.1 unnamed protein product [Adineta steineri]
MLHLNIISIVIRCEKFKEYSLESIYDPIKQLFPQLTDRLTSAAILLQFRAHDQSNPRFEEIYAETKKTSKELVEYGYQYDSILCGHIERLVIAWNFVANTNTTRFQLAKNLRVRSDCHQATKLIACIRKCEIIVRSVHRIHHFHTNG